ncbi:stalk domain-containing protein [Paenibacillus sp. SN-8-1]|uniref:stalk domain-containing protein n=1 Tax=Paenibacillus sp. SN-8-1 TaxID=3435409 RepID=UPI003D9A4645
MKTIFTRKVLAITSVLSIIALAGTSVYAANTARKITAYQDSGIKISVDGTKVDLSSNEGMMYPITYNGHSYVSAKAVAEAMGGTVKWNSSTQTVEISTGSGGSSAPDKDNSNVSDIGSSSNTPSTPSNSDVVDGYPQSTSVEKMFQDNKSAAGTYLALLLDAYRTNDSSAVEAWIKKNVKSSGSGTNWAEQSSKSVHKYMVDWRDGKSSATINALTSTGKKNAEALNFGKRTAPEDGNYTRTLYYEVALESGDYPKILPVYFSFELNSDNKWILWNIN